jgi:hypothetical protein
MKRDLLFWFLMNFVGTVIYVILFKWSINSLQVFQISIGDLVLIGVLFLILSLIISSPLLGISFILRKILKTRSLIMRNVFYLLIVFIESFILLFSMFKNFSDIILVLLSYGIAGLLFLNLIFLSDSKLIKEKTNFN